MHPVLLATVFGVIFLGELPDKTMFASLVLASRGRAGLVWLGAAGAFLLHVVIAVTVGSVLFTFLPHRVVEIAVAVMFLVGAVMAFRDTGEDGDEDGQDARPGSRTVLTAFIVIFIAEWGDLTQILTANLAARYDDPLQVGFAAVLALWAVAGIAMVAGKLLRNLPVVLLRRITGIVLLVLAGLAALDAIAGINTIF
ncbi:MAG TPA: TMEM165/GDT1 family protein [Pseudonocardiaceae bacterium]|nr:TMEM165/GDT1 family protein [Pseudonocardiaceae bacterium]